jgi:hypothetical protein
LQADHRADTANTIPLHWTFPTYWAGNPKKKLDAQDENKYFVGVDL